MNHQATKAGGNVFKTAKGKLLTQRINKQDIDPTLDWLESLTNIPHKDFKLGTTGIHSSSGDIDIAVNSTLISKDAMVERLSAYATQHNQPVTDYVRKTGISVHFRTPINGDERNGFVQTDMMFGDPKWLEFTHAGSDIEGSPFKGAHRAILMSSIAKGSGLKWSPKLGLLHRKSNKLVANCPDKIAELLLGRGATRIDLNTVESMLAKIKHVPEYNDLIADAKETFNKQGLELP